MDHTVAGVFVSDTSLFNVLYIDTLKHLWLRKLYLSSCSNKDLLDFKFHNSRLQNDESNTITQRKRNREKDEGLEVINRFNLNLYEEKVGMILK